MWTEQKLDEILSAPSPLLAKDMDKIQGDVIILGAGGKMGPSLALLAKRALAGKPGRVIAVSRFTDPVAVQLLQDNGVEIVQADLMQPGVMETLPDAANVIYMAGRKFGTDGQEHQTWAMNAWLPALVAQRYQNANIVVFSSGNIYPQVPLHSGGATEEIKPAPIGEYAMSCLARERIFEHAAAKFGTKICIYRLNYAVDLRYGVLYDIAANILNGNPVPLDTPVFNCIWQHTANEIALRCLLHCTNPANIINVTGPEVVSVKKSALALGKLLGKEPVFCGEEKQVAYLNDASRSFQLFGYPTVSAGQLLEWQAEWILDGGRALNKPTHFEERKGAY